MTKTDLFGMIDTMLASHDLALIDYCTHHGVSMLVTDDGEPLALPADDELIMWREAYEQLGISRATMYEWAKVGKLTPILIEGRRFVSKRQIKALRKRRRLAKYI